MAKHKINRTVRNASVLTGVAAAIALSVAAASGFGADEPNRHVAPATSAGTLSPWEECIANGSESCMDLKPLPDADDSLTPPSYPWSQSVATVAAEEAPTADSEVIENEAMIIIPQIVQRDGYTEETMEDNNTDVPADITVMTVADTAETEAAEPTTPETEEDVIVAAPTPETDVATPTPEPEYVATIPDNNGYMGHVGVGDVMENNYGTVSWNGGTIVNNYGEVHWNSAPAGINGTIVNNYGEVHHNAGREVGTAQNFTDSTIVNNYGEVLGYQGNIENDNSGGVVK